MAKIELLLQALTPQFHADTLRRLLSQRGLERFIGSVAFVQRDGVDALANELKRVAKRTVFFIGIRNNITSLQAVRRLLELRVKVFAVDTGARSPIFHPKLFVFQRKRNASVIIGSANITFSGLHNNVEAGALLSLDLRNTEDTDFLLSTIATLDGLEARFPSHVFEIPNAAAAAGLFRQGRLIDEDVVVAPVVRLTVRTGERDNLGRMPLARHPRPARLGRHVAARRKTVRIPSIFAPIKSAEFVLIWESRELSERDLNVPSGSNTNATGSMLWKKGAADNIDQRHFFRDEVFSRLRWRPDSSRRHIERAEADFQIVVKGLNYSTFRLRLSHNTDRTSVSYGQRNSMTQIHWGPALPVVAKRDLLRRIMSLYRRNSKPPEFLIEID